MRDRWTFSNSEDLTALNSTGAISEHLFDLEQDGDSNVIVTDGQIFGWFHVLLLSALNTEGDQGLIIQLRTSDALNGGTPNYLGVIQLLQADILSAACPAEYSIGVLKSNLKRYLHVWYMATNTSLTTVTGSVIVDAWMDEDPHKEKRIQKKPS